MTSYLTSMDTISLSRTVSEIFEFKVFRVWPWPLTPKGHLGSKNCISLESPYMTSYLTSMDTISLSRTVFEIFDFKVFRVWPWPLTPKGHLGSKNFIQRALESPYMWLPIWLLWTLSLYLVPFSRKFGSKFFGSNKMADFDLFKVKVIDRYFSLLKKGLTLTKRRRMTYCASKSVQPFWLHPHQRA